MGPKTSRLIKLLEKAERELRAEGLVFWADWVRRDLESIKGGDAYGIKHFLSAFGGMGSLTDASDAPELSKAYELASAIARELESD